jgi:D-proline reductase (dithiol) PrdE
MGIGPSTKETTLHHFQDPLVDVLSNEEEFDFLGIIVVGTPQDNEDKLFVGTRAAVWAEAMRADGAIISADGWGNSDVDFANTIEQLSIRKIPTVGVNFVGTVAGFVVTNEYMDTIVDMNKSDEGIETEVLGENSVTNLEARKAAAFLKLKMRKQR